MSNQDSAFDFFDKYRKGLSDDIHTLMLCKIDKYDHREMKAEVIPLNKYRKKDDTFEDRSLLIEVPIMHLKVKDFYVRVPYQKGDIVIVAFFEEDTENALLTGDIEETSNTRKHSLDDAVIIGSLRTFEKMQYTDANKDDLLITNEDETFKIVIKKDGEIDVNSNKNINFNSENKIEINGKAGVNITGPINSGSW